MDGITTLAHEQICSLSPGKTCPSGNQALIAAGTGLGMALLPAERLAEVPAHIILEPRTALLGTSTLALNNRVMRRSDA